MLCHTGREGGEDKGTSSYCCLTGMGVDQMCLIKMANSLRKRFVDQSCRSGDFALQMKQCGGSLNVVLLQDQVSSRTIFPLAGRQNAAKMTSGGEQKKNNMDYFPRKDSFSALNLMLRKLFSWGCAECWQWSW